MSEKEWIKGRKTGSYRKVLAFLMEHPLEPFTAREVAEQTGYAHNSCIHALWKISGHPNIKVERKGNPWCHYTQYVPPKE